MDALPETTGAASLVRWSGAGDVELAWALRAHLLLDSSLPIGTFVAGNGWEAAVRAGRLRGADDARAWLSSQLDNELGGLELPFVARAYRAALPWPVDRDLDRFTLVPTWRRQSRAQGRRLLALMGQANRSCHRAVAVGFLAARCGIPAAVAVAGYAQASLLAQVQVGVRLGLLTPDAAVGAVAELQDHVVRTSRRALDGRVRPVLAPRHEISAMEQRWLDARLFAS